MHAYLDYIHFNPVKHNLVDNVNNWEYSSFFRFVDKGYYSLDWGSFDDIKYSKNLIVE